MVDVETFEQLLTPSGQSLLAEVAEHSGLESDLALGTRLRRTWAPELVAAAVTQNRLRAKAVAKFGEDAQHLYFTPDALEQSTRSVVADHRARRLAATGATAVVDLGCGIGGDLIALARAGLRVRGIEVDPARAAIARIGASMPDSVNSAIAARSKASRFRRASARTGRRGTSGGSSTGPSPSGAMRSSSLGDIKPLAKRNMVPYSAE